MIKIVLTWRYLDDVSLHVDIFKLWYWIRRLLVMLWSNLDHGFRLQRSSLGSDDGEKIMDHCAMLVTCISSIVAWGMRNDFRILRQKITGPSYRDPSCQFLHGSLTSQTSQGGCILRIL